MYLLGTSINNHHVLRHILAIPATGATTQSASLLPAVVVPPAPGVVALLPASQIMLILGKPPMWIIVNI